MTSIQTPAVLTVSRPGTVQDPTVSITAAYKPDEGRYVAASISVEHPFGQVRSTDLRRVAVRRSIANLLRAPLAEANPDLLTDRAVKVWASGKTARAVSEKRAVTPGPQDLASAALVVRLERLVGGFPVRAVERACGVDYDNAKRWYRAITKGGLA